MTQAVTITESEVRGKAITFENGQIFIGGQLWATLNPDHDHDVTIVWRPREPAKEPAVDHNHYHEHPTK